MKKIFLIFILLICLSLTSCSFGQIEDVNGDDNYELATLSKEEIFTYKNSVTVGSVEKSTNSGFNFDCAKLSGNYLIKTITPKNRTLKVLIDFKITKGNAFLALVCDDEIIQEIPHNTSSVYTVSGSEDVQLRILGESCQIDIFVNIYEA